MFALYKLLGVGLSISAAGFRRGMVNVGIASIYVCSGVFLGACVGGLSTLSGTGARFGGILGLAVMLVFGACKFIENHLQGDIR